MKKITLFFIMLGFFLTASAQYDFNSIVGPTNVASGSPVTINLNDAANTVSAPASSTGTYDSFSITVDWTAGGGNPWSVEADLTFTTTAGSITIDPPTAGGANSGAATTLTFTGDLAGLYDPTSDGYIDLVLNQSFGGSNADWANIVVTLFETPTCIAPTGMTVSGVTATAATLDWTAGDSETAWVIEYNTGADFTPGNGEEEASISPTTTPNTALSSLTPASNYFLYYQADCGGGDFSTWVGPILFSTECVTFTAPYTEDFENAGAIPLCWSMDGGEDWFFDDDAAGTHVGDDGTISGSTASNNFFAWADASGEEGVRTLTSPLVDVSGLTVPALSFYLISDNEGNSNNNLDVEVWDGAAWNNMATYNTNTGGWTLIVTDISTLTITGDVQARFIFSENVPGDFYDDIAIDDVTFDEAPSCFNPSQLMANAITSNSAELSWSQDGSVSSWNIELVTSGTAPSGTPTASGVSNPYTASSLTAVTQYDYYVQADCGGGLSGWTGPFTFETLCDVFTPDYIEQFSTIIPDCWDEADNGDATTGPLELGGSSWVPDEFLNIGTGDGAYKINLWLAAKSDWLLSPQFDLTGGPFQVEFDFGIMQFASSTVAGTLGSDDFVQLLITNDNGVTWTPLLTYDNTSVVSPTGEHPVITLEAYAGQTVQFGILGSEGTVDDPQDNDIFVDNFRVRGIPTCPEPTDLTANNLSLTSTEVGWTETGSSNEWNIEYGLAGFALGTGTVATGVTTNPFTLDNLTSDTEYEFYVQAVCGASDLSSFAGPFQFFTGYCESIPSSNDGTGVENTTIEGIDFPSPGDVTYENQTSPVIDVFPGVNTSVAITFATGFTYGTNIWIDFDNNLVFDASELVFSGESTADNPTTLDASFVMPVTATPGEHRMRIGTADGGQATPNPCYNGAFGVTLDFTVNVGVLPCILPEASFNIVDDCDNQQFFIDVDITSLGDATSLEVSNDFDTSTLQVTAAGMIQVGPFPSASTVSVSVANEQESLCTIVSPQLQFICPPDNDTPCEANVAVVNNDILCEVSTTGSIFGAAPSGVTDPSCGGVANDDVWFQFVAQSDSHLISLANVAGSSATDINHSVYSGTCDNLTEIACVDGFAEWSSVASSLTIGETYFIRVYSGDADPEDTTFDLCITPYVAPVNVTCDTAANFCSGSDATDILYTYNTINVLPGDGQIDCLFTTPNPTFSTLEIGTTGDILLEIVQNSAFDSNDNPIGSELDVDFLLWGPYAPGDDLCALASVVDCSYSAAAVEDVTLLGAQQGELYLLLITNFDQDAGIIQVRQTNIGDTSAGSTIADIDAQIISGEVVIDETNDPTETDEVSVCGFPSVTIETDSPFADTFIWFNNDVEISGETAAALTITESGVYRVQAFDSQCNATADSQTVIVNLYDDPGTVGDQTLEACDGPVADGSGDFDLDALTTSLGFSSDFTVSYYTNMSDANQAINPVSAPYASSGETLIIRVEDADAANDGFLGCRQLAQLELMVNPVPTINQPMDFVVCDDLDGTVDGITEFDLTSIDSEVSTDPNITVTYHTSQENADSGDSPITDTSNYSSSGETIFVRAVDITTGCHNTTSFNLEINIVPLATFDVDQFDFVVCPNATVPVSIGIIPTNFTAANGTVTWLLDGVPISGSSGLTLDTVLVGGNYSAEITFNDSGCGNTITTQVIELESCEFPQGISPGVSPGQNDTFDLRSFGVVKLEIFNRNGVLVYSKRNYTNEWEGQTNDGEELPVGTYFYTVIYEGGAKKRSSWVYINR
ncbi:fibronectin type III domain-containing protein [Winogradskyella flava]|uniref:fibronectin type III domain-containing protein n=1 Tax=Winogradskyella flava TaxID=1884876 RepID=UPI0024910629|nr:gliding motility-associated C-terminal domain-containing protein [Winogradskyella flava]